MEGEVGIRKKRLAKGSITELGMSPPPPLWQHGRHKEDAETNKAKYNYDHQVIQAQGAKVCYGDIVGGGASEHMSVLVINAGNIDRIGKDDNGKCESEVINFITGKYHIGLIQEAASQKLYHALNMRGFRYLYSAIEVSKEN